jgi:hypothetical protein
MFEKGGRVSGHLDIPGAVDCPELVVCLLHICLV